MFVLYAFQSNFPSRFRVCLCSLGEHRFFSQANFTPFNSVMLVVELCVRNSFIFSVSALTVLQFWFLRDGNVVFFSDIILLKFSIFIPSCVSDCSGWFQCEVFRCCYFAVRFG